MIMGLSIDLMIPITAIRIDMGAIGGFPPSFMEVDKYGVAKWSL